MIELPGAAQLSIETGDVLTIETPGGGGWGKILDRAGQQEVTDSNRPSVKSEH